MNRTSHGKLIHQVVNMFCKPLPLQTYFRLQTGSRKRKRDDL